MILPDHEIQALCTPTHGVPLLEPYDPEQVEPASYDVRLGHDFKIFQRDDTPFIDLDDPADITKDVHVPDGGFLLLHPGEFILGVTIEVVHMPDNLVARIEGKSSIGRLGLSIHITAGFIDPGFNGPVTLEMASDHPLPLKLRPGKKIAQLSFHQMTSSASKPYNGRYQNASTVESSKYGRDVDKSGPPKPFATEIIERPIG